MSKAKLIYNQTLVMIEQVKKSTTGSENTSTKIEMAIRSGGLMMVKTMKQLEVKRKQRARTLGIYCIALFKQYKKYIVA